MREGKKATALDLWHSGNNGSGSGGGGGSGSAFGYCCCHRYYLAYSLSWLSLSVYTLLMAHTGSVQYFIA